MNQDETPIQYGSSRRSFFGKVLGGLAVAIGVKVSPSWAITTETIGSFQSGPVQVYTITSTTPDGWAKSDFASFNLKVGDQITIKGVWDKPRVITGDVSA